MIPWFLVRAMSWALRPFDRQVMAVATVGRLGADRIVICRPGEFNDAVLGDVASAAL